MRTALAALLLGVIGAGVATAQAPAPGYGLRRITAIEQIALKEPEYHEYYAFRLYYNRETRQYMAYSTIVHVRDGLGPRTANEIYAASGGCNVPQGFGLVTADVVFPKKRNEPDMQDAWKRWSKQALQGQKLYLIPNDCGWPLLAEGASEPTDPRVMRSLAEDLIGGRSDPPRGRALFERCAALGDRECAYGAALAWSRGTGGPQDDARSLAYMRQAADSGHLVALYEVGLAAYTGRGMAKDLAQAAARWRRAAEGGHVWAANNYANLLYKGEGVAQDLPAARQWAKQAAESGAGDRYALATYGEFLVKGIGGPPDPGGAALLERAVQAGSPYSALLLGICHRDGTCLPLDKAKARTWLLKAKEMGEPTADAELAKL